MSKSEKRSICAEEWRPTHDAHIAVNGECPLCGLVDPNGGNMTPEEAERTFG